MNTLHHIPGAFPLTPTPSIHEAEEGHEAHAGDDIPSRRGSQASVNYDNHSARPDSPAAGRNSPLASLHSHQRHSIDAAQAGNDLSGPASAVSSRPASPVADVTAAEEHQHQQRMQMDHLLHSYFSGLKGGLNNPHLDALITDRTDRLLAKGESIEDIQAVFDKGRKLDRITTNVENSVRALPYAVPGYIANPLSNVVNGWAGISPDSLTGQTINGAFVGVTAQTLRALSDGILNKPLADAMWMAEDSSKIDESVRPLFDAVHTLPNELLNAVKGGTGYDIRNLGAIGVSQFDNASVNDKYGVFGTLAAGAISANVLFNSHPMNLLARNDWEARYDELKNTSMAQQVMTGGIKRTGAAVESLLSFEGWKSGRVNVQQDNMLAEVATLGAGLAGVNALRAVVKESIGSDLNLHSRIAIDQGVNTLAAAGAYAAQGAAGVLSKVGTEIIDEAIGTVISSATQALAQMVGSRFRQQIEQQDIEMNRLSEQS